MNDFVGYSGSALFALSLLTMFLIVCEVLPLLSPEDQRTFVFNGAGRGRLGSGRAIIDAWVEHRRSFPQSKKRMMVVAFAIAGSLVFLSYPLSRAFTK